MTAPSLKPPIGPYEVLASTESGTAATATATFRPVAPKLRHNSDPNIPSRPQSPMLSTRISPSSQDASLAATHIRHQISSHLTSQLRTQVSNQSSDAAANSAANAAATNAPLSSKRTKVSRACDECRRRKTRCDIDLQPDGCSSCRRAKVDCTFERTQLKRGPSKRPRSLSTNAVSTGPSSIRSANRTSVSVPRIMVPLEVQGRMGAVNPTSPVMGAGSISIVGGSPNSREKLPGIGALLSWSSAHRQPMYPTASSAPTAPSNGTLPMLVEVAIAQQATTTNGPPPSPLSPPVSIPMPQMPSQVPIMHLAAPPIGATFASASGPGSGPNNYYSSPGIPLNQFSQQSQQQQQQQQQQQHHHHHHHQQQQHLRQEPQQVRHTFLQSVPVAQQSLPHAGLPLSPADAQILTEYYTWWHPIFPILPGDQGELAQLLASKDARGIMNALNGSVTSLPVPMREDKQSWGMYLIELIFLYLRTLEYTWLGAAVASAISMSSAEDSPHTVRLYAIVSALDRLHSLTHHTTPLLGHRESLSNIPRAALGSDGLYRMLQILDLVPNSNTGNADSRGWLSPPPEPNQNVAEATVHWLTDLKNQRAKGELSCLLPAMERTPLAPFIRSALAQD